jgi:hypothetical protein
LALQDGGQAGTVARLKGAAAGGGFVKDRAQSEDVGAGIGIASLQLLRCHVLQRPDDLLLPCEHGFGRILRGHRGRRHCLRQPEVQQLRSRAGQHDVRRLQVAVDDALPVCLVEGIGNLNRDLQNLRYGEGSLAQSGRQRLAFETLHDEIVGLILPADVMELADVRMVQAGHRARLALESLTGVRPVGNRAPNTFTATSRPRRVSRAR